MDSPRLYSLSQYMSAIYIRAGVVEGDVELTVIRFYLDRSFQKSRLCVQDFELDSVECDSSS